jgi:DNA polymerase elongation subunit (family B)
VPWTEEEIIDMDFTIGVEEHTMSLKFEKQYASMLVEGVKKRYAGLKVWEEGVDKDFEIDVTGYETVKSDTHTMFRFAQAELFRLLLNGADTKDIQEFVNKKKAEMFAKPGHELSFSKSISKPLHKYKVRAQHIKAVEYGQEAFSWTYGEGDRVFMVKVKGCPEGYPEHEGIIPIDEDAGVPEIWEPFVDRQSIWYDAIGKKLDATLARIGMDVIL